MEKIVEDCFFIAGSEMSSNIYILKDKKSTIIIDTGDGGVEIKEKPDFVFLTHGHFDHTGGVREDWGENWDVFLRKEDFIKGFPYHTPKNAKELKVNHITIGSFDLDFIHTPGHTPGGITIFEKNRKILFTGDTLFSDGWIGRTDLLGGNEELLFKSLKTLVVRFASDETRKGVEKDGMDIPLNVRGLFKDSISIFCPGHGLPLKL